MAIDNEDEDEDDDEVKEGCLISYSSSYSCSSSALVFLWGEGSFQSSRQRKRKRGSMAGFTFNPYSSMVKINDAFADGQADAGAVRAALGGVFNLLKFIEYFVLIFGFYSDAVVLDINLHLFVR